MINKEKVKRVAVDCVFRALGRSREFTTTNGNFEASNMLMNKLDKLGVVDQSGKLVFEFDPSIISERNRKLFKSQVCVCGHSRFAHKPKHLTDGGDCQALKSCGCKQYKQRKDF